MFTKKTTQSDIFYEGKKTKRHFLRSKKRKAIFFKKSDKFVRL